MIAFSSICLSKAPFRDHPKQSWWAEVLLVRGPYLSRRNPLDQRLSQADDAPVLTFESNKETAYGVMLGKQKAAWDAEQKT